jgi:hypothetical protein
MHLLQTPPRGLGGSDRAVEVPLENYSPKIYAPYFKIIAKIIITPKIIPIVASLSLSSSFIKFPIDFLFDIL